MASKSSDWRPGPTVCRCCFTEGCYKDISTEYFWMGKREVYSEMLHETFDVSIAYSVASGPNSNSRLICEPCISRLRDASDFKRQVKECEKTFMQHLDPGSTMELELQVETTDDKSVKLELVKEEQKLSDDEFDDRTGFQDDDDDDDDLDDEPLTTLASKIPKKESVDLSDLLDNAKAEKRKSTAKVKASPAKKPKKKEVPKPSASKAPAPKVEKKKKDSLLEEEDIAKANALMILRNSTAYPFKVQGTSIRCVFCLECFLDPNQFRSHMDTLHENVDRSILLKPPNFPRIRVDITNLRCKSSNEIFTSLDDLAAHLIKEHGVQIDRSVAFGLVPLKLEKDQSACLLCDKRFTGIVQLSRHTGSHYCRYICENCGKNCETVDGMRNHKKKCYTNLFPCRYCKHKFESKVARDDHRKKSKLCWPQRCNMCNERFLTWELKEEHLVKMHGKIEAVFSCKECNKTFRNRTLLYFHFKATHTQDIMCEYCEKTFPYREQLREHVSRVHTGDRPMKYLLEERDIAKANVLIILKHSTAYPFKLYGTSIRCMFCSECFQDPNLFRSHMDTMHENADLTSLLQPTNNFPRIRVDITNLRCKCSSDTFTSIDALVAHLIEKHNAQIDESVAYGLVPLKLEKDKSVCTLCSKRFTGLVQLSRHTGTHFSRYMCEICGKSFETIHGIRSHNLKCNTNLFPCRYCKNDYESKKARDAHRKESKTCWPQRCTLCDERFLTWELKEDHLVKTHGKSEKVFPCKECDKIFQDRRRLYFHFKATHTKDNICQYCEKSFPCRSSLTDHICRVHTGDRPRKCSVCDKGFITLHSLRQHELIHDDAKKCACPPCGRLFVKKRRLMDHVQKHHPEIYDELFPDASSA